MSFQPLFNLRRFVCAIVINDQVEGEVSRGFAVDFAQKANKFFAAVTGMAGADDFAIEQTESRKQRRCPVPLVVMSRTCWNPWP